ncbi:MAG TPA: hypothetical protein DEP72_08350 [Clostridiales bacterium]|nr:MAG: hypothetical protein A2Y18_03310 [Clostridiales bacterium GWD2_32_19]HCC08148.1 hypothetical protein [Clostridiales bacterium]
MGEFKGCYLMPQAPILLPEIGERQIKNVKNTFNACYEVASSIAEKAPGTVIIVTPHGSLSGDTIAISSDDVLYGNFDEFGNEKIGIECKIDKVLTENITNYAIQNKISTIKINKNSAKVYGVTAGLDYGSMVPLYFINKKYKDYKVVNITYGLLSKLDLYKLGMIIRKAINNSPSDAVLIGSGDFSHCLGDEGKYNYHEDGEKFDRNLISLLEEGNEVEIFNLDSSIVQNVSEYGLKLCYIILGAINGNDINAKLLSYEGPFGVGYGVMEFSMENKKENVSNVILGDIDII